MGSRKTVLDYVMEGGINGKYFLNRKIYINEETVEAIVYQIKGQNGIDNTIPANPLISIGFLNKRYGSSPEERTREEWLGMILRDEEATNEEIAAATEGKTLSSKLQAI